MSVSVLIADDQSLIQRGFRMILEAEEDLQMVGEAENGEQAADLARRLTPDVVLMDIRMPGTDGIEPTRRIVATIPKAPAGCPTPRSTQSFPSQKPR